MDLLFVGGGFENFNWLAEFVVQIPRIVAIWFFICRAIDPMTYTVQKPLFVAICIFTCRAIDPMTFAIQIPIFGATCIFNCRAIDPMKFAVQIPMFVVPGGDFANWLFAHTLPLY